MALSSRDILTAYNFVLRIKHVGTGATFFECVLDRKPRLVLSCCFKTADNRLIPVLDVDRVALIILNQAKDGNIGFMTRKGDRADVNFKTPVCVMPSITSAVQRIEMTVAAESPKSAGSSSLSQPVASALSQPAASALSQATSSALSQATSSAPSQGSVCFDSLDGAESPVFRNNRWTSDASSFVESVAYDETYRAPDQKRKLAFEDGSAPMLRQRFTQNSGGGAVLVEETLDIQGIRGGSTAASSAATQAKARPGAASGPAGVVAVASALAGPASTLAVVSAVAVAGKQRKAASAVPKNNDLVTTHDAEAFRRIVAAILTHFGSTYNLAKVNNVITVSDPGNQANSVSVTLRDFPDSDQKWIELSATKTCPVIAAGATSADSNGDLCIDYVHRYLDIGIKCRVRETAVDCRWKLDYFTSINKDPVECIVDVIIDMLAHIRA